MTTEVITLMGAAMAVIVTAGILIVRSLAREAQLQALIQTSEPGDMRSLLQDTLLLNAKLQKVVNEKEASLASVEARLTRVERELDEEKAARKRERAEWGVERERMQAEINRLSRMFAGVEPRVTPYATDSSASLIERIADQFNRDELMVLLSSLSPPAELDAIVGRETRQWKAIVTEVVRWAERHSRTGELESAAKRTRGWPS